MAATSKRSSEATFKWSGRGGVDKKFLDHTTPSARTNEASRLFRARATNPDGPPPAEEGCLEPLLRLGLRSSLIRNLDTSVPDPEFPKSDLLLFTEALVGRLYKHCRGPRAGRSSVPPVVILRQSRRLDLLQSLALLHGVQNPVANDLHHVAVLEHVRFVADAAVTGNHHGSAFLFFLWNADVQNSVQANQHAIDSAAGLHVDYRDTWWS